MQTVLISKHYACRAEHDCVHPPHAHGGRNRLLLNPRLAGTQQVEINHEHLNTLMLLLAPFAPHLTEELWELSSNSDRIFDHTWPEWDDKQIQKENTSIAVQVLGKLRGSFEIEVDSHDDVVIDRAMQIENVRKHMEGKEIIKNIVIKNKLVNFVVK